MTNLLQPNRAAPLRVVLSPPIHHTRADAGTPSSASHICLGRVGRGPAPGGEGLARRKHALPRAGPRSSNLVLEDSRTGFLLDDLAHSARLGQAGRDEVSYGESFVRCHIDGAGCTPSRQTEGHGCWVVLRE